MLVLIAVVVLCSRGGISGDGVNGGVRGGDKAMPVAELTKQLKSPSIYINYIYVQNKTHHRS